MTNRLPPGLLGMPRVGLDTGGARATGVATDALALVAYRVTHTADSALATQAAGGTKIFSTISAAPVPTSGQIRVSIVQIEFDETEGTNQGIAGIALKVGAGALVWAASDDGAGTAGFAPVISSNASVASAISGPGGHGFQITVQGDMSFIWDIEASGLLTGSQDIAIYMGDNVGGNVGELTITGTTFTAVALVEIIDTA